MKTVTRAAALAYISDRAARGEIFALEFTKRTTGETRRMTCRTGVHAHLVPSPSKPGVDFKAHGLLGVFDMEIAKGLPEDERKKAYRSVPLDGITRILMDGSWTEVTN